MKWRNLWNLNLRTREGEGGRMKEHNGQMKLHEPFSASCACRLYNPLAKLRLILGLPTCCPLSLSGHPAHFQCKPWPQSPRHKAGATEIKAVSLNLVEITRSGPMWVSEHDSTQSVGGAYLPGMPWCRLNRNRAGQVFWKLKNRERTVCVICLLIKKKKLCYGSLVSSSWPMLFGYFSSNGLIRELCLGRRNCFLGLGFMYRFQIKKTKIDSDW